MDCPIITPYTVEMGIPEDTLLKLYRLRKWEIGPENPIPFAWPSKLRHTLWSPLHQRDTGEPLVLKQYQLQMMHHMARMSRFINGDSVGLGKTLEAIATNCWLYDRIPNLKTIVLTTKSTAQPLSARVLTPDGFVSMGTLQYGDKLVDPDGGVCQVQDIVPHGVKTVYRITMEDGGSTEACGDHLWLVRDALLPHLGEIVVDTNTMIASGLYHAGQFRYSVPAWGLGRSDKQRIITSIQPARETEVQCIRVSSQRSLYITDDYIVTHNTHQWSEEYERFSTLRPFVMSDKYKKKINYPARYAQLEDFLTGDEHEVMVCKYTSMVGKRRQINAPYDEDGIPTVNGKERISPEVKRFLRILKPHGSRVIVICDESHKFKTIGSNSRTLVEILTRPCAYTWALTATAIKNGLDEFYSIAHAIGIRPFGAFKEFSQDYCIYKEVFMRGRTEQVLQGYKQVAQFKAGIRPFFLGRSQRQVKEPLPRLSTVTHPVDLDEYQTQLLVRDIPEGRFQLPPTMVKVGSEWIARERDPQNKMAQPLSAKVLTMNGFLPMGMLKIGDALVDPDGGIGLVEGIYPQGVKPIYKVTMASGATTRSTLDHLWMVRAAGKPVHEECLRSDGWFNWKVTTLADIELTMRYTPCTMQVPITKEVKLYEEATTGWSSVLRPGQAPMPYMSESERRKTLTWLLWQAEVDDMTYLLPASRFNAEGVLHLVRGLGGLAKLNGDRIEIRPPSDNLYDTIESIEYVGEEECQCILVGSKRHLYVTDDYIVTHNTMLSVFQLVANHPALIDPADTAKFHSTKLSPKEDTLLDMLDGDLRGEKVIVFTKSRSWIDRLEWLTEHGRFTERKFLRITGAENEKERNVAKQKFQDPDGDHDLIVINAAAMEGVNLQQSAHLICLDVPWAWGELLQLVGRMVRMASPHSACTLHLIVARGSIDEYAIETLRGKKGVFERILGESHSAGLLDDREVYDMDSGMEQVATEDEFWDMLRAHVKSTSLGRVLDGSGLIQAAQGTTIKVKPKEKHDVVAGLEEAMTKWGL